MAGQNGNPHAVELKGTADQNNSERHPDDNIVNKHDDHRKIYLAGTCHFGSKDVGCHIAQIPNTDDQQAVTYDICYGRFSYERHGNLSGKEKDDAGQHCFCENAVSKGNLPVIFHFVIALCPVKLSDDRD